ncbi:hypothetical protein PQO03_13225 [Lentisphaera profundi]|uniref:TIR domain-containing protein n=1 Tax=Lentisphaera profundi TaxID=1658616 RepID=A0ABY7VZW4_9BACT|nr:hypothetical protein [Lentisphaera profundi]WDE98798.1 hypothetical protein PQO03_13225 [Lentisphaera profundi]
MSLPQQKSEINRLIKAFEKEADKFHDLKFSLSFIVEDKALNNRRYHKKNHTIMLWQYYGKIGTEESREQLIEDLRSSDLKWGLRGAESSCFAVVEGEEVDLFIRMARRAGSLFNEKESRKIRTLFETSIQLPEPQGNDEGEKVKTVKALNHHTIAVWLHYLLYHLSLVNPIRAKAEFIEPEPFTLSLLALENLYKNPTIKKVDKSLNKIEDIKFKVAMSFPGEKRHYVSKVMDSLRVALGNDQVFYDYDYQSQLAKPDLDTLLQQIYRNNSDLVVVFLCEEERQRAGLTEETI